MLAIPTTAELTPLDLIRLRAYPVHPLGVRAHAAWGDGQLRSPVEFFFHDLDHARFKIREDLRIEGIDLPDAYVGGTTLDPVSGRHRGFLHEARGCIGGALWSRSEARRAFAARLLDFAQALDGAHAAAAELLLFEIVHEKSHALEEHVLDRELATDAHVSKIRRKNAAGFYGAAGPATETLEALDDARRQLRGSL